MSLQYELTKLEPDELSLAAQRSKLDTPDWLEETIGRYCSLGDINYVIANYYGCVPDSCDRELAGAAAYVMTLGLVQAAETQLEASNMLIEVTGDKPKTTLHDELILLTAEDVENGADAVFYNPLWRAEQDVVEEFFLWYPSLYELLVGSTMRMVATGKSIEEMMSYINGGLAAAQLLVEVGNARLNREDAESSAL